MTAHPKTSLRLPGLIDIHVHLREPGQTHKEDFTTGSKAAIAGGYTMIVDMPNNAVPLTTPTSLKQKAQLLKGRIFCDIGLHYGSLGDNTPTFISVARKVVGLKLYLNQTTGGYIIDVDRMKKIYRAWHRVTKRKPILLHAEDDVMPAVTKILSVIRHPTHICHVSSKKELSAIIRAKKQGLPVTCGVCPHHLFLNQKTAAKLGSFGLMKPSLKASEDQAYLWKNLSYIDMIESDHAPHTKKEKRSSNPPFGVPGLETTLPLLLTAMDEGLITLDQIIDKCYTKPRSVFMLPEQKRTYVEVERRPYRIRNAALYTKCGWSPFDGWKMNYRISKVVLRGVSVYENGSLQKKSHGKMITSTTA